MAYINQEMKKVLLWEVEKVLPKSWKVSARIKNSMKICLTLKLDKKSKAEYEDYLEKMAEAQTLQAKQKLKEETKVVFLINRIREALNSKNYDNSIVEQDFHQVNYYSEVLIA
ncbi:hypothetical protein BKK47_07540 [Rodentibacter mrazii]|uniref:Uncharacterized protein n=1 Tax=Rodentibacter mrazii TaxID=1908257 RepID=A0A1V3IEJ0_9PAST|nr:hypothetical protein [Rodentibacter mrazii]OOF39062.1 hypothetical protein BKK47_07540 [Rodentibacter mrazii]